MSTIDLSEQANQSVFAQLVGVSQPAIAKQVKADVLPPGKTLGEWLLCYTDHLREQAAGRGGSQQEQLAIARTEEATVKAALGRLDYLEKTKTLVLVDDCVEVLQRWAGFASVQYKSAMDKLITELQAEHKIEIDPDKVVEIAEPTADRVADYAKQLGASLSADR